MTIVGEAINFLLVDDLEENLLALEALLQRDGLTCLKARSGEEALELLLVHDVALALLDVQMPGMDGFQLAEFMRGIERARHIPIIFLTAGSADLQRRFRGYEAGAVDFIQKPIEADILRSKANVFFDLHEQRRQILSQRDELEAYADALRTVDRHKNEFLAVLGHELRNPVMALISGLELLKRRDDAETARDIRAKMERQVSHLTRLVEDLLDISRIDQGKISLKKQKIELQPILESAIEASRPLIDAKRHTLSVGLPPDPVWLDADSTRIAQVVTNLLNNAAKYTPTGGQIQVCIKSVDDVVEIEVTDNGIGIPTEMQSKIFEIFAQVEGVGQSAQEGLGIGLALVKQLVTLHGGVITLKSDGMNLGSSFTVRLPLLA
jgi:signal transduction histidine kinase